jgi:WD40 repeat protein
MKPILQQSLLVALIIAPLSLATAQDARQPIPDQNAQTKALKLVLDIFLEDLEKATTNEAKSRLAATLFQQGKEVKDDAAVRYVCFREARDLAAKGGDINLALVVIDEMNRNYDVDALLQKADVLGLAVASATEKDAGLALVEVIRPLLNEAIDQDHYKAAHQLGEALVNAAKKARSPSLVLELQKRVEEIKSIEQAFSKTQGYLDRVRKNPDDAEANLELGKYFGYQKRRWEKALLYFARSSDAGLQQLARTDLAQPKDVPAQLALADGWWDLASQAKAPGKLAIQMRAMYWYDKAMPALSGLNRTKAQKRIDIVQDQLAGVTTTTPIVAGPVGELRKYEGHAEEIKGVAFSHDGRYVASASRDQSIRIWDLAAKENKEAYTLRGHSKEVWAVAFHPNNRHLLSVSWDATARLWDFKAANEIKRYTHTKDVNGIALSRDASQMLTGCDDEKVYLWNLNNGEVVKKFSGHANYVYGVAFSPDGRLVASGSVDKTVRVYDLNSGQVLKTFEGHNDSVTNVAFLSNTQVLASGDSVIRVWDLASGKEARRFEGHNGRVQGMAVSPDGRRVLTGGDDRTMKLWDAQTGKVIQSFAGHTDSITCVAFSHDGRRAVSGGYDRTVRVWGLPAR